MSSHHGGKQCVLWVDGFVVENKRMAYISGFDILAMSSVLSRVASVSKSRLPVVTWTDLYYCTVIVQK